MTHTDLSIEMDKLRASFEAMLRPVVTFMNSQTGQKQGAANLWGFIAGGIGITVMLVTVIMKIMGV